MKRLLHATKRDSFTHFRELHRFVTYELNQQLELKHVGSMYFSKL